MEHYQISLLLAAILAIAEITFYTFIFLSFSLSLVLIALVQYLSNDFSLNREIILFSLFSIVFVTLFRKFFYGKRDHKKIDGDDDVNMY